MALAAVGKRCSWRSVLGWRGCKMIQYLKAAWDKWRGTTCNWCGQRGTLLNPLNWCHNITQHDAPELANDPTNGCTMCRQCHFVFHFRNWKLSNPAMLEIVRKYGKGALNKEKEV